MADLIPLEEYQSAFTLKNLVKYLIEGLAISVAAFLIPNRITSIKEVVLIGLIASLSFFILDVFAPATGPGLRQGAGLGIGYGMVSAPPQGLPLQGAAQRLWSEGKGLAQKGMQMVQGKPPAYK